MSAVLHDARFPGTTCVVNATGLFLTIARKPTDREGAPDDSRWKGHWGATEPGALKVRSRLPAVGVEELAGFFERAAARKTATRKDTDQEI